MAIELTNTLLEEYNAEFVKQTAQITRIKLEQMIFGNRPSGWCTPSRQAITGTWETVVQMPETIEDEPIQVEDDNVFAPRPVYEPVEDF